MKSKDCWDLKVYSTLRLRVTFDEEVSLEEAIERFNEGHIEDVIDEEVINETAIGEV